MLAVLGLLTLAGSLTRAQVIAPLQAPAGGRVTYFIATGEKQSEFRDPDVELAAWALRALRAAAARGGSSGPSARYGLAFDGRLK
jgi:hypothetical protein